jgi:PAS domain S-box-containing protein
VQLRTAELQETNHELETSRDQYRGVVETTQAVPWQWELGVRRFTYVGPQAQRLLGCSSEEWLRPGFWDERVHPEDRPAVQERWSKASAAGAEVELEYRLRRDDGAWRWVRSIVGGGRTAEDTHLSGLIFDITERRQLELDLRQAQKLESVGRLAAGVAHEINTPIQFVSDSVHFVRDAFVDMGGLLQRYGELRSSAAEGRASRDMAEEIARAEEEADITYLLENVPKALERSIDGLNRVATIVRSMKEFAHPDQTEMASADLNQAIQSTLTIARNEYKYVAELETELGELPSVNCLAGEVNQVVLNIVVNAAHAIGDVVKGTETKGKITVRTRREGEHVIISIGDTGGGIPANIRERIFDPFFTTKDVGEGTGQGLAIARSVVVDKHGGELTFETEMGKGTTFFIRLPIAGKEQSALGVAA